jgi:hypothetical protein
MTTQADRDERAIIAQRALDAAVTRDLPDSIKQAAAVLKSARYRFDGFVDRERERLKAAAPADAREKELRNPESDAEVAAHEALVAYEGERTDEKLAAVRNAILACVRHIEVTTGVAS